MIYADFFNDLLGQACIMFFVILMGIGWLLSKLGNALKNKDVWEAAKVSFWMWFLSDD